MCDVSLARCGQEFGNRLPVYFLQEIIQSVLDVGWLLIYFYLLVSSHYYHYQQFFQYSHLCSEATILANIFWLPNKYLDSWLVPDVSRNNSCIAQIWILSGQFWLEWSWITSNWLKMTLLLLPANLRLKEFLLTTKLGLFCQTSWAGWLDTKCFVMSILLADVIKKKSVVEKMGVDKTGRDVWGMVGYFLNLDHNTEFNWNNCLYEDLITSLFVWWASEVCCG